MTDNRYFKEDNRAFEAVVRLSSTDPDSYDQDAIREDIQRYAQVSSLGKVHQEAMQDIRSDLKKYGGDIGHFPEAKCYGIVGQYGDGKTHFLSCLSDLLRNENDEVYPKGLNLLVLDPFNFPRNPVDIVSALRERVQEQISPDAVEHIPKVKSTDENLSEEFQEFLKEKKGDDWSNNIEIRTIEGDSSGRAFAKGCTEIVKRYKYDAIVLLMDEIEKISREGDIDYQELDRYREFFDQIGLEVPVYFLVTAPVDQWNHFENIHSGAMDRMFGSQPRKHVRLQTLNEDELAQTWQLRRNHYLRTDKELPAKYKSELYPLHKTTLRAIHEIAARARSNRTAIELMKSAYNDYLTSDEGWVPPGRVFEKAAKETEGSGSIFNPEQHSQILEHDKNGVLTSIAGTLEEGIRKQELIEVLDISEADLASVISNLRENSWIDVLQEGDGEINYRLHPSVLSALKPGESPEGEGDVVRIVKSEMANIDQTPDLIYRNLFYIFQQNDFFDPLFERARDDENYFIISGNFGNYHDRKIVVSTADARPDKIERYINQEDAELALAVNHGGYNYDAHGRIIGFDAPLWDLEKEYEVEGLRYELGSWISAYNSLESDLEQGGRQLLNTVREWAYQETIGLDEFDLNNRIQNQLSELYPTYPGPVGRMNSSAKNAYKEALSRGKVEGTISVDEVRDYGYAETDQSIEGYMDEWEKYGLASIDRTANPWEAEIQISETENLILDELEEDSSTSIGSLVEDLRGHGYREKDVKEFVEILVDRDRIRKNEDDELVITTQNLTLAKTYYDVVKVVADWLTDDQYPKDFQEQYVSNRDQIVEQRGTCKDRFEKLGSRDFKSEETNPVASFIDDVDGLQSLCVSTFRDFENTQIAQKAAKSEERIQELRDAAVENPPPSNQFTILVSELGTKGANLANGARRQYEDALGGKSGSIFQSLQTLSDEFADEFDKIGPYNEYSTTEEMRDVAEQFDETRPETNELATALEVIESFDEQTTSAKEVARNANQVMKNLVAIEEFDASKYQTLGSTQIEEESQEVAEKYMEAGQKNEKVGKMISDLSFKGIDADTVDEVQEQVAAANNALQQAKNEQDEVDSKIEQETRRIHNEVGGYAQHLSEIVEDRASVIQEMFAPKSVDSEVISESIIWWDELEFIAKEVENLSNDIKQKFPDTASELVSLEERIDDLEDKKEDIVNLRDDMFELHEEYFEAVRDELPPAESESLEERVAESPQGNTLEQIETLLDRVDEINTHRGIELPPLRDRILEHVDQHKAVVPEELAAEIPDSRFHESQREVVNKVTSLIQAEKLALQYKNNQIILTKL